MMKSFFQSLRQIAAALVLGAGLVAGGVSVAHAGNSANYYEKLSNTLIERAMSALAAGKPDEARTLLEQAVVANPRNAKAYSRLGLAEQRLGKRELAQKYFAIALEIDPNELNALSWSGQEDLFAKNLDGAEAKLQRLARLCGPSCAEYRNLSEAVVTYKSTTKSAN